MYETVGKCIKMNLSIGFWTYFIWFYTFLYSLIHFQTFSYNSEILPCQVCKKINEIKHRKPYKNVYFCRFFQIYYIFIRFCAFLHSTYKKKYIYI